MDDKLLNTLVALIFVGVWVFQYFQAKKQQEAEDRENEEHEDQDEDGVTKGESNYGTDPYLQVQEEIRRKVAERQAAERQASLQGRTTTEQPTRAQPASSRPQATSAQAPTSRQQTPQPQQPSAPKYDQALIDRLAKAGAERTSSHTPFPKAQPATSIYKGAYQAQTAARVSRVPALRERLRTSAAAREAIVLREILGPRGGLAERDYRD